MTPGSARLDAAAACQRYGSSVLRRCRAILRDPADAEDAAQEVFVTLACKGHTFRGDADLSTWLYRVATNICLNRRRGDGRRRLREEAPAVRNWSNPSASDPYAEYSARDLLDRLVGELDPLAQAVLVHRYLDGMTQEEIASVTGKSRRTICDRLEKIAKLVVRLEGTA